MMLDQKHILISAGAILAVGAFAIATLSISPKAETSEKDSSQGLDMSMPDMSKDLAKSEKTKDGCVKPPRPDWAIDAPATDTYKVSLLIAIYDEQRRSNIIETNDCSCSNEYPAWDAAQKEFDALMSSLGNRKVVELDREKSRAANKLNASARKICKSDRGE